MEQAHTSSLSLFQPTNLESSVLEEIFIEYRPTASISKGSIIEFSVPGTSSEYINLKKSRIHVKFKILKANGKPVESTDLVALKCHMSSLFRQVDVMLNQKVVSPDVSVNYSFKSIIDTLLKYTHDAKESQLSGEFYFKDSSGSMDDPPRSGNGGATDRYNLTKTGSVVSAEGPIHADICQQEKLILNGVPICIRLHQSLDAFRLISKKPATGETEKYQVEITDAILKVCLAKINPKVMVAHSEALNIGEALYPYWRSNVKSYTVPKENMSFSTDDILCGICPSSVIVGIVSSEAYVGSYHKNPYNFANFDLSFLELMVNGNSVPGQPFQPNYKSGDYTSCFLSLFGTSYPSKAGNWLWRSDYPKGYCLYKFTLQGQIENTDLMTEQKRAHTRLNVRFGTKLPESVTIVVYSTYPSLMKINQSREVLLE